MRDRQSSSPVELFISSTKMASTSSTNVNELLPGLETFLRSMVNSTQLNGDHRQIAAMYVDKIDQIGRPLQQQQTSMIDDQSFMNAEIISDDDSDDFSDEEEEQRKLELAERQLQQQQSTPTAPRRSSTSENTLYHGGSQKSSAGSSQWYIDMPKNTYLEALSPQSSNGSNDGLSSKATSRLSISTPSSTIIADGLLLTYDEHHNWIWRYYVLDDFDLICFPADKKSQSTSQRQSSDQDCSPLWVSDMTNAKVHTAMIDKIECLCLQIGLAEAIYVRPPDPNQITSWLKAFRDAASTQKSKDNSKGRSNVKTLSRNARRMFAQFNRKKGQIVSHLLDQMANVTGVDEKTRKHCELRGFLVVSLDNLNFATKYCTIVDGIFRVHKSRLSEQTDHELTLNRCTLSFPEERTRDIQFALIDEQAGTIFIRGNNIYSMGRLLNTLAKYVEITGSSHLNFATNGSETSTPLSKRRQSSVGASQPHIYSDVDGASSITTTSRSNEIYSPASVKAIPAPPPPPQTSAPNLSLKTSIYHNASKLHENDAGDRTFIVPTRRSTNGTTNISAQQNSTTTTTNETYDQPKSYDNVAVMSTPVDRNNNHVFVPPQRFDKAKTQEEKSHSESRLSRSNGTHSHRSKSKSSQLNDPPSSPDESTVFCLRSSDSASSQHRNSHRRRQNSLPRRPTTQPTPTDYVNKLANLFTKNFSSLSPTKPPASAFEHHISTQTYDTVPSSPPPRYTSIPIQTSKTADDLRSTFKESSPPKRVYDIPITIERPTKCIVTPFEQYQKPIVRNARSIEPISPRKQQEYEEEEETPYAQGYDNLSKNDGIGKFRFVVPFNHSPASAFISSKPTIKPINSPSSSSSSTISSFSTIRQPLSPSNPTRNVTHNTPNSRSTLMTAV